MALEPDRRLLVVGRFVAALYERDFVEWIRRQVAALRAAQHGGPEAIELDHEHLAQEIEQLGERARSGSAPSSGCR